MSFWFKHRTIAIPECDRIMNRSNLFVSHHAGVRQQEQTDTVASSAGDLHLRRVPRLINKPLTRSRLCQATLPAAGNAKIARCMLGEIYGSIADGEEQDAYEKRCRADDYIRCRELVNYWTANPVVGIPIGILRGLALVVILNSEPGIGILRRAGGKRLRGDFRPCAVIVAQRHCCWPSAQALPGYRPSVQALPDCRPDASDGPRGAL